MPAGGFHVARGAPRTEHVCSQRVEVMWMRWLRFIRPVNVAARREYERALRRRAQHQAAAQLMLR